MGTLDLVYITASTLRELDWKTLSATWTTARHKGKDATYTAQHSDSETSPTTLSDHCIVRSLFKIGGFRPEYTLNCEETDNK